MPKIHGVVFLIIGIFVAIASYKINYSKLSVFFYAGLFFIIYGIARMIIGFINNEEKKIPLNKSSQNQLRSGQSQRQQYKRCQNCGNAARIHHNFCPICGNRLY